MKLTFFQSLALSRNDYDLLTETLYRFFSSIDSLFGLKSKKFSLRSRESVYIGDDAIFPSAFQYEADFAGKFNIDSKLLAGGNVKKASFRYGSSNTSLALKPFPLLDIEQSNFEVNDLFATGLSLRSAKNVARKALKGDDIINGTYGDDYLRGYKGDDVIYGGEGFDILRGGRGKDTYVYTSVDEAPGGTETGISSANHPKEKLLKTSNQERTRSMSAILRYPTP